MNYGNGQYVRDDAGTWRYALTGEAVPGAKDVKRKGEVVAMFAPELLPDRLLSLRQMAQAIGLTYGSAKVMRHQKRGPVPIGAIGSVPFWSEGVIIEWLRVQLALEEPTGRLPPRESVALG